MKEIKAYKAEDGTVFEDEMSCTRYAAESYLKQALSTNDDYVAVNFTDLVGKSRDIIEFLNYDGGQFYEKWKACL